MKSEFPAPLPLLSGRQAIQRAALYPLPIIAVLALVVFGLLGWRYAAGIALAGTTVVMVSWIMARIALGKGSVHGAGSALLRLLAAIMIKWALLIILFIMALVVWRLPLLALLMGLIAGLGLQMRALYTHQTSRFSAVK